MPVIIHVVHKSQGTNWPCSPHSLGAARASCFWSPDKHRSDPQRMDLADPWCFLVGDEWALRKSHYLRQCPAGWSTALMLGSRAVFPPMLMVVRGLSRDLVLVWLILHCPGSSGTFRVSGKFLMNFSSLQVTAWTVVLTFRKFSGAFQTYSCPLSCSVNLGMLISEIPSLFRETRPGAHLITHLSQTLVILTPL